MTSTATQEDYSPRQIRVLLKSYNLLREGLLPEEMVEGLVDWDSPIDKGRKFRAPFELACILEADIQRAFSKLPRTEQFVLLAYLITDMGLDWCASSMRISEKDVENITENAIQIMYEILNGRKQRRRE